MFVFDHLDLRVFSDVATDFHHQKNNSINNIRMIINGETIYLSIDNSGRTLLRIKERTENFANFTSLLASERFANLRQWASNQEALLSSMSKSRNRSILPVGGLLSEHDPVSFQETDFEDFNEYLEKPRDSDLHVLVMDGPAGSGKTTYIRKIALQRARDFSRNQGRLILHAENRGRTLQVLDDLIAGSLQRIRVKSTFDQLPVLVKYGLITLVLDGFDEFSDPSGFKRAWAQLSDLLELVTGYGQVILSGRETLVSRKRMVDALPNLNRKSVEMGEFTLQEVSTEKANNWLENNGIPKSFLSNPRLSAALEPGSYGLRPFFLSELAGKNVYKKLNKSSAVDILAILIDALFEREINEKLPKELVENVGGETIIRYLRAVCEEIARDMADNENETIPDQTIKWIAELCIPDEVQDQYRLNLIHHADRLPFLSSDEGTSVVRFTHRQFFVFFQGVNAIKAVSHNEIPKYLRRNVLGPEFLEAFPKALLSLPSNQAVSFRNSAISIIPHMSRFDRGAGNIAAILLASLCEYPADEDIEISTVSIDELYLRMEISPIKLSNVSISVLNANSANMRAITFKEGCQVITVHSNNKTKFPDNFPTPEWQEYANNEFLENEEESDSLKREFTLNVKMINDLELNQELLERVIRYRPFWLREQEDTADQAGRKIILHREWSNLIDYLEKHELVRINENHPASGRPARFIHLRIEEIQSHFEV